MLAEVITMCLIKCGENLEEVMKVVDDRREETTNNKQKLTSILHSMLI